jgi:hypothetical protein
MLSINFIYLISSRSGCLIVSLVLRTEKQINSSKSYHRLLLCYEVFENTCDSRSPQFSQSSITNSSLWSTVHLERAHISIMGLNVNDKFVYFNFQITSKYLANKISSLVSLNKSRESLKNRIRYSIVIEDHEIRTE